ncbi:MAG: GSCFA domain-containing protein [Bacteroidales bacterium]|nr:GSCFA domain-containing protein [Bacteroidales bacterium]
MSQFRTEIFLKKSSFLINYRTETFFIGSCFSDNIGKIVNDLKFPVLLNPFGVLYNPVSVKNALTLIIENKKFTEKDLNFASGKWFSYQHHGSFSSPEPEKILEKINLQTHSAHNFLSKTKVLFITFGTAWFYRLKETNEIVANCHKQPSKLFDRELLTVSEIVESWTKMISALQKFNHDLKIVFTLSPVRHWKDGAVNNQLSKSTLHLAIQEIIKKQNNCFYFPTYEIMMDDLRDYRFYTDDYLHPNNLAINYIWAKFCDAFIEDKTLQIAGQIEKISKALNHKILHQGTKEHKKFLINLLNKIKQFIKQYPQIDYSKEIDYRTKELASISKCYVKYVKSYKLM